MECRWCGTYLGRTGLERLHGPAEHLELAVGELRSCIGGGVVVVRHGVVVEGCR
jgi:hypothetical protein